MREGGREGRGYRRKEDQVRARGGEERGKEGGREGGRVQKKEGDGLGKREMKEGWCGEIERAE